MTVEEASGEAVGVWPDNMQTVNVFVAMATQWRVGMNGPVGMDFGALYGVMRMLGVPRKSWLEVFEGVRIMEDVALAMLRKK